MATNEKSNLIEPTPTVRTHLITALYIMDEKGRGNKEGDSQMLWNKDWDDLRLAIMDALFLSCEE